MELTEEVVNKILEEQGGHVKNVHELVDYFIANEDQLEKPGVAAKTLKLPLPLLRSIIASHLFHSLVYKRLFFRSFKPSVLAEAMQELAKRATTGNVSTRDLIAIIKLVAETAGVETRQRVTHDVNVHGGFTIVIEAPYSKDEVVRIDPSEVVEVDALPAGGTGELVPEIPEESRERVAVRE